MYELLMLPKDWEERAGIRVIDADGWYRAPGLGPQDWDTPISEQEFNTWVSVSTIEELRGPMRDGQAGEGGPGFWD